MLLFIQSFCVSNDLCGNTVSATTANDVVTCLTVMAASMPSALVLVSCNTASKAVKLSPRIKAQTDKRSILAMMYANGWSAVANASKTFHNFATRPDEQKYLGCIHPITNQKLV
jgi:hypothetical protein